MASVAIKFPPALPPLSYYLRSIWFLCLLRPIFSVNFLFFLIGTSQYERNTFEFLAQEMARRGHKVLTVKPILVPEEPRLVKPLLHMVHEKVLKDLLPERLVEPLERVWEDVPWRNDYATEAHLGPHWAAHKFACQRMLNSNLMEVLAREQLELAILYSGNPCQLGFVHALGIPFVIFDLDGISDETLISADSQWDFDHTEAKFERNYALWDLQPVFHLLLARISRAFSLFRESIAQSGVSLLASTISRRFHLLDHPIWLQFQMDSDLRRKFPAGIPDLNLLKRNAQFFLANTDPLFESPRMAFSSRLLPVGGLHIDTVRPLFSPWNESISSAEQGIILVSFGTQANTNSMPKQLIHSLLSAFRHLGKYRIFWRISPKLTLNGMNATQMELLSASMPHLNITSFFPQNELLAHSRCRLLITNGGMHSLMEALHWGVPLLGIPLYGQNLANLEKMERRGLGILVEKNEAANGKKLLAAIRTVLNEPRFARTAKAIGREVRSRPASAFDRTLHALESTARRHHSLTKTAKNEAATASSFPQFSSMFSLLLHFHLDFFLWLVILFAIFAWLTRAWLKLVAFCLQKVTRALANKIGRGGGGGGEGNQPNIFAGEYANAWGRKMKKKDD